MGPEDPYLAAAARIRDTMRWLLTSLAAVGALLLAGVSLTSIGQASGSRLWTAIIAFAVALMLVITAALVCGRFLGVAVQTSLLDVVTDPKLCRKLDTDPRIIRENLPAGVASLPSALSSAEEEQLRAYQAHRGAPHDPGLADAYAGADVEVARLGALAAYVTRRTAYDTLQSSFKRDVSILGILCLLVGLALATFAWAANPPEEAQARTMPLLVRTATPVELVLTEAGRTRLQSRLGAPCVAEANVPAVVIEDLGDRRYTLAIAASETCTAAVEIVDATDGIVALPSN